MTTDYDYQIILLESELKHYREQQQIMRRHIDHHDTSIGLLVAGMKESRERLNGIERSLESAAHHLAGAAGNLDKLVAFLLHKGAQ